MLFPTLQVEELIRILETNTIRQDPAIAMLAVLAILEFIVKRGTVYHPVSLEPGLFPTPLTDDEALFNLRIIAEEVRQLGRIPGNINWEKLVSWCIRMQVKLVPSLFPRTKGT